MLRWLTHILDIKNILGMQRVTPPVPPDPLAPEQCLMYSPDGDFLYTPVFSGSIDAFEPGYGFYVLDSSQSGVQQTTRYGGSAAELTLIGDITFLSLPSSSTVNHIAVNNTTQNVTIPQSIKIIDLRNADQFIAFYIYGSTSSYTIEEIFAIANTTNQRNAIVSFINGQITTGIVWVDRTQTYAQDIITAAENKGWTVYEL